MKKKGSRQSQGFLMMVAAIVVFMLWGAVLAKNTFKWRCAIRSGEKVTQAETFSEFDKFVTVLKHHDYNGVFYSGSHLKRIHLLKDDIKARVQHMVSKADQLGIAIIPMSNGSKSPADLDPNYCEAFANEGTPFEVTGSTGRVAVAPVTLKDPGFESPFGMAWKGGAFKQDNAVKRSGNSSLSIQNPGKGSGFSQAITVKPHRTYKLSIFLKLSEGFSNFKELGFMVMADGRVLLKKRGSNRNKISSGKLGGDWFLHTDEFSSRDYARVTLRVVVSERTQITGTVWFDDVEVQEAGLYNSLIRNTLPVVVKSSDGGKVYSEGNDYTIGKELLNIPEGSAITDGETVLVDWYTKATPNTVTPPTAFCSDEVWDLVKRQVDLYDEWFQTPAGRLMMYSEWRVGGWDPACIQKFQIDRVGSGPYYGHVANMTESIYRVANNNREALVFNDDYDPYHNAKPEHHSVNGGSLGSWTGLSERMIILNWNVKDKINSLRHFAGINQTDWPGYGVKRTKQRQIISAGTWGTGIWGEWENAISKLEREEGLPDDAVIGIGYHAFSGGAYGNVYDNLGPMADFFKNAGRWGSGRIPFPESAIETGEQALVQGAVNLAVSGLRGGMGRIRFQIPDSKRVVLTIRDVRGRLVKWILNERIAAGGHERTIDTSRMAAGIYFVRLRVAGTATGQVTKKMVLF